MCIRDRERATHPLEKLIAFAFDPIGTAAGQCQVAPTRTFATDADAYVKKERQCRSHREDTALKLGDEFRIEPATTSLIGITRIGEAIADQPGATLQRRLDRLAPV